MATQSITEVRCIITKPQFFIVKKGERNVFALAPFFARPEFRLRRTGTLAVQAKLAIGSNVFITFDTRAYMYLIFRFFNLFIRPLLARGQG